MQTFPFTPEEIKFFKELNKNKIPYIIVGLSAAAMQGAPIVTKDVDLWFKDLNSQKLQKLFRKCGISYIPSIDLNPPVLAGKGIELLDVVIHVHGIGEFETEYKKCIKIKIHGIPLNTMPLSDIIKSKRYLSRQKDLLVLPVLQDTLCARKEKTNG